MSEQLKGSLTISRPRGGSGLDFIEVRLTDEISGTTFVEAQVELADFTEALVGLANVPCMFEPRFKHVGMKYEHKQVNVPFNGKYTRDETEMKRLATKAFKPFEMDGWRGRVRDLFNHHNRTGDGYTVTFTRYVNPETGEPIQ